MPERQRQFKLFFSNFAFVTSSSFVVTFKAQAQDITLNTQEQKHVAVSKEQSGQKKDMQQLHCVVNR